MMFLRVIVMYKNCIFDTSVYRSKLMRVVSSVKHKGQLQAALNYIELMREHVKDNVLCDDLSNHLTSKYNNDNERGKNEPETN